MPAGPEGETRRFTRLWTRKEACVKAAGGRLAQGMELPVAHPAGQFTVHRPGAALPGPWRVQDLTLPDGYAGAVALDGTRPFRAVVRSWRPPPPDHLVPF